MPRDVRQTPCVLVALFLGACRFDADYGGTELRCPPESPACPDGYACVAEVCVTGGGTDAPATDASACELAAQAPDNDLCGAAIDLTAAALAAGGTIAYGDTTGYVNNLTPSSLPGCTGEPQPGPDALYRMTLAAGDTVTLTLSPEGWTGAVYLIDACTSTAGCEGGAAAFSQASIAITAPGTYYVVVDAPASSAAGCFALAAAIAR